MANAELKDKVKGKIDLIEESNILEEILQLIEIETAADDVFVIPEAHKKELELGLKQKENGQIVSNDFVNQRIAKWLLS